MELLFVYLGLGVALRFSKAWEPERAIRVLSQWVIYLALPATVLVRFIPRSPDYLSGIWGALSVWAVFGLSALLLAGLGMFKSARRREGLALLVCMGLGNTSFVGFPLIQALRGEDAVAQVVALDQMGTFLIFGTVVSSILASGPKRQGAAKRVLVLASFPPLVALVFALVFALFLGGQGSFFAALEPLAATLVPVAMVTVGLMVDLKKPDPAQLRKHVGLSSLALLFKLVIAPALVFFVGRGWVAAGWLDRERLAPIVLENAMAPMITSALLAVDKGLAPRMVKLILVGGILLSLITVPTWNWLLLAWGY